MMQQRPARSRPLTCLGSAASNGRSLRMAATGSGDSRARAHAARLLSAAAHCACRPSLCMHRLLSVAAWSLRMPTTQSSVAVESIFSYQRSAVAKSLRPKAALPRSRYALSVSFTIAVAVPAPPVAAVTPGPVSG